MAAEASFGTNNPFRRKDTSARAPVPAPLGSSTFDSGDTTSSDSVFADTPPTEQQRPQPPALNSEYFQKQLQSLPQSETPPPATTFSRPKPVKKVRVQSPPPSLPDSTPTYPRYPFSGEGDEYDSDESSSPAEEAEAFGYDTGLGLSSWATEAEAARDMTQAMPPNPFQKTLEDLEQGSRDAPPAPSTGAAPAGKGALDVSSFGRLLMTGQAGPSGAASLPPPSNQASTPPHTNSATGDAASMTDASSVSRQSLFDATIAVQETPRTSHEISESGEDDRALLPTAKPRIQSTPATLRKKPPPPDSRHGKLIKIELKGDEGKLMTTDVERRPGSASSASSQPKPTTPPTPSDVNKPLPPAPNRSAVEDESIFDREAAGKVPELTQDQEEINLPYRPPTPPNASHSTTPIAPAAGPKKPPPPPRRSTNTRLETRKLSAGSINTGLTPTPAPADEGDVHVPRSSMDSVRSRSSSIRQNINANAPAPPPPRRPNPARRQSLVAPSIISVTSDAADAEELAQENHAPPQAVPATAPSPVSPPATLDRPAASVLSSTSTSSVATTPSSAPAKLSPPPLPPARHASVRVARPPSAHSIESHARRSAARSENTAPLGPGGAAPPPRPPPPPRHRGSSKSSLDAPSPLPVRMGLDSARQLGAPVAEEESLPEDGTAAAVLPGEDDSGLQLDSASMATDILADLDALRREVDAARGAM